MAPGGTLFRFTPHFGKNVLRHGSHEWLPYSKDEVRLKTVNNNLSVRWARNMDDAFLMQVCYNVENERRGSNYG